MIYNFTGFHGCACICDLEVIKNLVIVSEMPENEGTSVTNFAEQLATIEPDWLETLRGKDLICWCAPEPCHADVLLRLANDKEQPLFGINF